MTHACGQPTVCTRTEGSCPSVPWLSTRTLRPWARPRRPPSSRPRSDGSRWRRTSRPGTAPHKPRADPAPLPASTPPSPAASTSHAGSGTRCVAHGADKGTTAHRRHRCCGRCRCAAAGTRRLTPQTTRGRRVGDSHRHCQRWRNKRSSTRDHRVDSPRPLRRTSPH